MTVMVSVLFLISGVIALVIIACTVMSVMPAIRALRAELDRTPAQLAIHVSTRETRLTPAEIAMEEAKTRSMRPRHRKFMGFGRRISTTKKHTNAA